MTYDDGWSNTYVGLYIGINGCSFKTEEQLETIKGLPLDKILLETDAPWCDIRATSAGSKYVKTTWESVRKEKWQGMYVFCMYVYLKEDEGLLTSSRVCSS